MNPSPANAAWCTPAPITPRGPVVLRPRTTLTAPRPSSARGTRACAPPPEAASGLVEAVHADAPTAAFTHGRHGHAGASLSRRLLRKAAVRQAAHAPPPRDDVPGPPPLPVVGNALDVVGVALSELMLTYTRNYGSFLRFFILKDVLYLTSDPEAILRINNANSRNYLDRWTPPGFEILLYDGRLKGLVFSQGKYWMQHRQIMGSVFRSQDFLRHYIDTVFHKTTFMVEGLWPRREGRVVNIHQQMRMLTLDIIGSAAFGAEFGAMTSPNGAHQIEECLSNILHGVLDVIKSPVPLWRVMRTPGRAAVHDDLQRLQKIERGLIRDRRKQIIAEDAAGDTSKKDLLGLLLRARDNDRFVNFMDDDLMWDVHDVIFAGHETTASALAATIFLVAGDQRVLRKIQEEVATVLPDGRAATFEDIQKLKYLDMALNEALRLYPPTALIGRKAKNADVLAGFNVPAGANILMSPYVMGHLESLWDNPEEFRPERFAPDLVATRHPMIHTPFGAGPRVCLGARMATMEAKAILAMIFSRYSFERTQDHLEVDYDSTVSFKSGMDMIVRRIA